MKKLCIIPARGGSKRIPRKNVKLFLGKPIIAYSIEAALNSGLFDEVMVSTDDAEIAEIAVSFGARVPFLRSNENASDFATTFEVVQEVIAQYQENNQFFELVCCVYSCAPFVSHLKLSEGYTELIRGNFDSVFPVMQFGFPIQRALVQSENGKVLFREPESALQRSQDLKACFHDAGQFYWMRTERCAE